VAHPALTFILKMKHWDQCNTDLFESFMEGRHALILIIKTLISHRCMGFMG